MIWDIVQSSHSYKKGVRLVGLAGSLARSFVADHTFMPQIVATVGLPELVEWLGHVGNMALYTALDAC